MNCRRRRQGSRSVGRPPRLRVPRSRVSAGSARPAGCQNSRRRRRCADLQVEPSLRTPHGDIRGRLTSSEEDLLLLADAQTSGGLLVAGELPGAPVIGELVPRRDSVLIIR